MTQQAVTAPLDIPVIHSFENSGTDEKRSALKEIARPLELTLLCTLLRSVTRFQSTGSRARRCLLLITRSTDENSSSLDTRAGFGPADAHEGFEILHLINVSYAPAGL